MDGMDKGHRVNLVIEQFTKIRVCDDPDVHGGIACLLTFRHDDGEDATIGLKTEALRTLIDGLISQSPPTPRTLGRN